MILVICNDGLIGDFLGVFPVVTELAKQGEVQVRIPREVESLFQLLPKRHNVQLQEKEPCDYQRVLTLDISKAFHVAHRNNYYMSQAHFACLGLPVPGTPPKAELEFERLDVPAYDFIMAPFSRSLPPQERWPRQSWQRLVDLMKHCTFCVIGHDRDDRNFVTGDNVSHMYGEPFPQVINLMKNARRGLISVVSGPSHLAFHLSITNFLLTNQNMTWGNNPDAVQVTDPIPTLQAERLIAVLQC